MEICVVENIHETNVTLLEVNCIICVKNKLLFFWHQRKQQLQIS